MKQPNRHEREELAATIASHISKLFDKENEHFIGDEVAQMNPNDVMTAFLLADFYIYRTLTGDESRDVIDYTHLLNKLSVHHVFIIDPTTETEANSGEE